MAQAPKKAKKKPASAAAAAGVVGAPGAAAMAKARTVVMDVMRARFGNIPFPDDLELKKLQLNAGNLASIAQNIQAAGIPVNNGPIQVCKTIIQLITAVARVIEAVS
jgi:hypothetical protein